MNSAPLLPKPAVSCGTWDMTQQVLVIRDRDSCTCMRRSHQHMHAHGTIDSPTGVVPEENNRSHCGNAATLGHCGNAGSHCGESAGPCGWGRRGEMSGGKRRAGPGPRAKPHKDACQQFLRNALQLERRRQLRSAHQQAHANARLLTLAYWGYTQHSKYIPASARGIHAILALGRSPPNPGFPHRPFAGFPRVCALSIRTSGITGGPRPRHERGSISINTDPVCTHAPGADSAPLPPPPPPLHSSATCWQPDAPQRRAGCRAAARASAACRCKARAAPPAALPAASPRPLPPPAPPPASGRGEGRGGSGCLQCDYHGDRIA